MSQALFKYTGSKRYVADQIISHFPKYIDTYYEPFLGGGSVFLKLLESTIKVDHYVLSDSSHTIIDLFNLVQSNPDAILDHYESNWELFQGYSQHYYDIRDQYNQYKNCLDWHFLSRTCYNGVVRYNSKGDFNVSHHFGRPGINPKTLEKIVYHYHNLMKDKSIYFFAGDFTEIDSFKNDVVFCDPPYTHGTELYKDTFDQDRFERWLLNKHGGMYCFTLNSKNGSDNELNSLDSTLYSQKVLLNASKSGFSRLKGKDVEVKEYFYIK